MHTCTLLLNRLVLFAGTYDIQGISVISSSSGEIRVTSEFIQGSTAIGILIAIITTSTFGISQAYFYVLTRRSDQLHLQGIISNLVAGDLKVSVFIVEEDGLPFNRTAMIPQVVSVVNSK